MKLTWKPRPDARYGEEKLYAGSVAVAVYKKSLSGKPEKGYMILLLPGFSDSQNSIPFEWDGGTEKAKADAETMVIRWFEKAMS